MSLTHQLNRFSNKCDRCLGIWDELSFQNETSITIRSNWMQIKMYPLNKQRVIIFEVYSINMHKS